MPVATYTILAYNFGVQSLIQRGYHQRRNYQKKKEKGKKDERSYYKHADGQHFTELAKLLIQQTPGLQTAIRYRRNE